MKILDRIKRRRRINGAIQELSSLEDRMLLDIGIERGNIAELVEKVIDGNTDRKRPVERNEPVQQPGYQVSSGAIA